MKILLTGSAGFLGNVILSKLTKHEVFTLNRKKGNFQFDLSKSPPVLNVCFELVIHNAGKAHSIPKNDTERKTFFKVNYEGTKNLLKSLERDVPGKFLFISSVAVYGIDSGKDINEDSSLDAKDTYGFSKIQAERFVLDWCQKNNVICTILRLPLVVGQNPPGNLHAMIKALNKGYYFNIDGGKTRKSMVLAEDVANFILKIAPIGGIYNLTDGIHPNFYDLSHAIAKKKLVNVPLFFARFISSLGDLLGVKAPINSLKLKKITSDLTFDDKRARELGWNPQSVLEYLKINDL